MTAGARLAFVFVLATAAVSSSAAARAGGAAQKVAGSEESLALFRDADTYPERRRAELRADGKQLDRATLEMIAREQRELAARHAAKLAARTNLAAGDLYYLGLLYNYAAKPSDALAALRRFLDDPAAPKSGAAAQLARSLVAAYAAQSQLFAEAERARADYLASEPRTPYKTYQIEYELALAYAKAKQYERAAGRGVEAFRLAQALAPRDLPPGALREQLVFNSGTALADIYAEAKRKGEALAAVVELQKLALDQPSANLYRAVARKYRDRMDDVEKALAAAGPSARAGAPELKVAEWLDGPPVKLAELSGRVVLVDFWYDWCVPCRIAMPTFKGWQKKYGDRGLTVIGLTDLQGTKGDEGGGGREQKLAYLRKLKGQMGLNYTFAVAERGADNLDAYGVTSYPTSFLIDRRGAVRYISIGLSAAEMQRLGDMIEKLLKEPAEATEAQR